jgi:hypothetical protein
VSRNGQRRGEERAEDESGWARLRANARATGPVFSAAMVLVFVLSGVLGLERLQQHVERQPEAQRALRLELDLPPDADWVDKESWRPLILSTIRLPEGPVGPSEDLLRDVARQMLDSGWVSEVQRVVRTADGTIRVLCQYRRPVAMLLTEDPDSRRPIYVPVDKFGYRLPIVCPDLTDSGSWIQILGVEGKPPKAGERFGAEDARAGVKLAALIFQQSFRSQVAAVDVTNFQGRSNRAKAHILIHPRKGKPIAWGSAIGDEIEESSAPDKLRMLGKYFASVSPQAWIDLSVYSNAGVERMPDTLPRAEALASSRKQ